MFRRRYGFLEVALVCVASLVFCSTALPDETTEDAQEASRLEAEEPTYEIAPVVVRTSRIREAKEDPSSFATVIQPEQFASQFRTTEDLLSRTAGVNIKRLGGLGQFSTVSIRGSSAEQVLVLLDGVRLNTGEGGSVDFSTIPLDSIERIEVIRGGGTTLYGSDAIGGVINIITKEPTERPEGSAYFSYGSEDTIKASLTGRGRYKRFSYLLSATHFQSDGDFDYETPEYRLQGKPVLESEEQTRFNNDFKSNNILAKADYALTDSLGLTLNNDFFYTERGQPGTVFDPREKARQEVIRNLTQLKLEKKRFLHPDVQVFLGGFGRYSRTHFTDPEPSLGSGSDLIDTTSKEFAFGVQLGAEGYWQKWGSEHVMNLHGELRWDELRDEVQPGQEGFGEQDRTSHEWVLQDEAILLQGRLSVVPAVRYEHSSDFGGNWTGKIGLVGKPKSWLTLKTNFQNSFRKPNFTELYFPNQGFIRGNPNLLPEEALNFDAGFGLNFDKFFFQTAYFRNWIDESVLWLPVSFFTIAPVNTGPVDAWGVEVDTEYRPWKPLFLAVNYTFLDATSEETGKQLEGRPRHTVNFKVSLQDKIGEIYTEVQYLSAIPVRSTSTGAIYVNERAVLDVGVTANFAALPYVSRAAWLQKLTLSLEVKNVNDASVYDSLNFPLPGRMFFVTLYALL